MKKIRFAVIAAAVLAAATITTVKTIRNTNPLLDANVEALAETEAPTGALWYNGSIMCCGPGNVRDCDAVDENGSPIYVHCNF